MWSQYRSDHLIQSTSPRLSVSATHYSMEMTTLYATSTELPAEVMNNRHCRIASFDQQRPYAKTQIKEHLLYR